MILEKPPYEIVLVAHSHGHLMGVGEQQARILDSSGRKDEIACFYLRGCAFE